MPEVRIGFYRRSSGRVPVAEWITSLTPGDRDRVGKALDRLQRQGTQLRGPHTDGIAGQAGLLELRGRLMSGPFRIYFCFIEGSIVVLLESHKKTSASDQKRAILHAAEYRRDLQADQSRHLWFMPDS